MSAADVEDGVANSDGLVGSVNFNNADNGVTLSGSDFEAVSGELNPITCADGSAIGDGRKCRVLSCGLVVALCALKGTGLYHDGALIDISSSSGNVQNLENGLAAVIVDGVGLFVENEAVVDETTLSFVIV